jgi:hypothetical protein
MQIDAHLREAILAQPEHGWTGAVDADGQPRDGAEVCELTGWVDLHTWPAGTRMLCRRQDAHPGAQLRFTYHDGYWTSLDLPPRGGHRGYAAMVDGSRLMVACWCSHSIGGK